MNEEHTAEPFPESRTRVATRARSSAASTSEKQGPEATNTETPLSIGPAWLDESWHINGGLMVTIDGLVFSSSSKYTILELGWAVYITRDDFPHGWIDRNGEVRPADEGWNELASGSGTLVTSHPILVALSLMGWWHLEGRHIPLQPSVPIPSFAEAVEYVRGRQILNHFNQSHGGSVPGLARWAPTSAIHRI